MIRVQTKSIPKIGDWVRLVLQTPSFHLDTTDNSIVSAVDLELTGHCDSNTFSLDTLDPENFTSDEDPESSGYVTRIQPIEGLGEVFVDADSPDGPWVLVMVRMVLSRPVWILVEESTMQPVKVPPASMLWSSSKTAPKWLSLGAVQAYQMAD